MKIVKKRIIIWIVIIVLILAVPLVLMQFKDEIDWNLLDFVIIGIILIGTGVFYELIARKSTKIIYRVALGIGLIGIFLLFWVNGAVGISDHKEQYLVECLRKSNIFIPELSLVAESKNNTKILK